MDKFKDSLSAEYRPDFSLVLDALRNLDIPSPFSTAYRICGQRIPFRPTEIRGVEEPDFLVESPDGKVFRCRPVTVADVDAGLLDGA